MLHRYFVIGTGAIGAYVGSCLRRTNAIPVVFHCRSNYASIKTNGLTISDDEGLSFTHHDLSLSNHLSEALGCTVGLLCTKSYENDGVLGALSKTRYPKVIICMQNGIRAEEKILRYLPDVTVISAVCFIKVTPKSPHHFHHNFGQMIAMAQYDPTTKTYLSDTPVLSQIKRDFSLAGITFHLGKFKDVVWTKLAFNLPLCLLSILHDRSTTELVQDEYYLNQFYRLLKEIEEIAKSEDSEVDLPFIMADLKRFASTKKPVFHSMKCDFDRGLPLELESMFFNVLEIARENQVPTPQLNTAIENVARLSRSRALEKRLVAETDFSFHQPGDREAPSLRASL